ncbi:hypothetical protein ACHAWF_017596 [Thalassiosira exigua]
MAPPDKSSPATQRDEEIEALLGRLHSGCRFVSFEDSGDGGKGGDVSNFLRNASPPDETHAELGRALAHSFINSFQPESSSFKNGSEDETYRRAVDRGERIITSLCCGGDSDGGSNVSGYNAFRYASVGRAFFGRLRGFLADQREGDASIKSFIRNQWIRWCILCEELALPVGDLVSPCDGGGVHVLNACLMNYGFICHLDVHVNDAEGGTDETSRGCAGVYERLMHHTSRKYLIRTCTNHAVSMAKSNNTGIGVDLVDLISPMFHSCVLKARTPPKYNHQHAERRMLLREISRGCSTLLDQGMALNDEAQKNAIVNQSAKLILYLTVSLVSYLSQGIKASFSKVNDGDRIGADDVFDLGYEWLREITELLTKLMAMEVNSNAENLAARSIIEIISSILPQFTPPMVFVPATFEMEPLFSTLVSCVAKLPRHALLPMANATVALRLGSLALGLQDDSEVHIVCNLMLSVFQSLDETSGDSRAKIISAGVLAALGCVFRCRSPCFASATQMLEWGASSLQNSKLHNEADATQSDGMHLTDIIISSLGSESFQSLIDIITSSFSDGGSCSIREVSIWRRRPLSLSDQNSGLLLGLSLLHISHQSCQNFIEPNRALSFLRSFLLCYPRMASRVAPSLIEISRSCQTLHTLLEFLASPCIVSDSHGAHIAWTSLSSLVKDDMPTAVRSTVIRLLPNMCSSNKRLLRRCMNVIGKSMVAHDPIIRISATAALSDMARFDLLRDVEEIVGWVQIRLSDEESAAVHYALATLRFLVVNEDLNFDLVVRVLEKRLGVDLSNVDAVLGLRELPLEGIVALLGEGGLEEDDDEDEYEESNDEDAGGPQVSQQSIKAVSLLVELALSTINDDPCLEKHSAVLSNHQVQKRIFGSLASYSSQVLGLDAESIRLWEGKDDTKEIDPCVQRFIFLKDIVLRGLDLATKPQSSENDMDTEVDQKALLASVVAIGRTLLLFEEDVHGSFLFRGRSSSHGSSERQPKGQPEGRVLKSVLSALPTPSQIHDMHESDPRSSSATAIFFSISASESHSNVLNTEDILLQISDCIGDANDPLGDPLLQAIQICSLICCMSTVWKSIQNSEEGAKEVDLVRALTEEWAETYGGGFAYVAMAAFVASVDDSAEYWTSMNKIQATILEGQDNYLFESEDTKMICLALVASRMSRTADARVAVWIDSIEQSLSEHSQQTCFGSFFGLGIIVSNLKAGNIKGTDPSDTWRRQQAQRAMSILWASFNSCLAQENDDVVGFIASIKCGEVTGDLSKACSDLESLAIRDGSAPRMKSIMIGLSLCFPVLSAISTGLLNCALSVIDKLPWGSGKGVAIAAAYKTALECGVLGQKDVSEAIAAASGHAQDASTGFGDALFSLASLCRLCSGNIQKELGLIAKIRQDALRDNKSNIGSDDKMMSILAGCAAIGELPGLASLEPNICAGVKKNFVADTVKVLEVVTSNNTRDLKCRGAATVGLGVLCAMSKSANDRNQTQKTSSSEFGSIQAKDGSLMHGVIEEIEKTHSFLSKAPSGIRDDSSIASKKLCALFSMLEPIAMPGHFGRVIELTLKTCPSDELKTSSIKLLVSQTESRRRIGFDGRGFIDLSTRMVKMPYNEFRSFAGPVSIPAMASSLKNLIFQIPTSTGEEVIKKMWAICRTDLTISQSSRSMVEFLTMLKIILISVKEGKPGSKKTISPALLRILHKVVIGDIFTDLCDQNTMEDVWTAYLQCLELIPSATFIEAGGPNGSVSHLTVVGMAVCAPLCPKPKRKQLESWIARQEMENLSTADLRGLLLAILTLVAQPLKVEEMVDSILNLFSVMVVKGIDTMCLYLLAAKIAFWWESQELHQLSYVELPRQRTSNLSSLFVTKRLGFSVHKLPLEVLTNLFESFIYDLPPKIAVLCNIWKEDLAISNSSSRILKSFGNQELNDNVRRRAYRFACIRRIAQLIDGGED